ncbi:expressed unknown protein [Seminavis robusta]|uniref:Uncharacterized protein n=1 Tax=Seminavis robusta TaxID=568900 RepID=A0A9N8EFL9_9STRA|nr:expressed unknown protein [Seminavis robusta]|eukprot:Sro873_g214070.1 n/a (571) ;mRNA; r:30425-32137
MGDHTKKKKKDKKTKGDKDAAKTAGGGMFATFVKTKEKTKNKDKKKDKKKKKKSDKKDEKQGIKWESPEHSSKVGGKKKKKVRLVTDEKHIREEEKQKMPRVQQPMSRVQQLREQEDQASLEPQVDQASLAPHVERENFVEQEQREIDNIERHRQEHEAEESVAQDSIELHREVFEEAQSLKLHEWYEEESLAADLESLKRKPWYQQMKEREENAMVQACYNAVGIAPSPMAFQEIEEEEDDEDDEEDEEDDVTDLADANEYNHQHQEQRPYLQVGEENASNDVTEGDDTAERTASTSSSSSSDEDSVDAANEAYQFALGRQDGMRLDFSRFDAPRPIPLEDDRERLEYARRSVERMMKIEELRKSREELRSKLEEKRRRRKERYERIQNGELTPKSLKRHHGTLKEDVSLLSYPETFLVDLTNINDNYRHNGYAQHRVKEREQEPQYHFSHGDHLLSFKVQSFQEEIPVIVDLSNQRKPQQILDLTNIEEPPLQVHDPFTHHLVPPLPPNHRIGYLRRDREEKLHEMTQKYQEVIHKKISPKERRDEALTTYQRLMERVTRNVRKNVCV